MKKEKKKKNSYVVWRIPESKHRLNPRKYGIKNIRFSIDQF